MNMRSVIGNKKRYLGIAVAAAAVIGLTAFGMYYFLQYKKVVDNPEIVTKEETQAIVDAVKKHMTLPSDEQPTLATVQDKDKLKDQPFFADAQNDDKILIYTKAKKAIVYRQKEDKVINVGPILLDQGQAKANIQILNGTNDQNKVAQAETILTEQFKNELAVALKSNATKTDYAKTKVVDNKGSFATLAASIATKIGGEVGSLPSGEVADKSADITVIVGK